MSQAITPAGEQPEPRDALTIISASGLPERVQELLRDVVRRTRLWKGEKAQVAIELVAHFHDGVEAGQSAEQLLARFGDAKTAAKLIRRAKRRNRPLWWHVMRAMTRAAACVLFIYAGLVAWMVFTHPNPSVDYRLQLNRIATSTPESDHGWPIYRQAFLASGFMEMRLEQLYRAPDQLEEVRPGDAEWTATAEFLHSQEKLLQAIRQGAAKRHLGLFVGNERTMRPEDVKVLGIREPQAPQTGSGKLTSESMIAVLLPHLAPMWKMANLLAADMTDAAEGNDGERLLADYRAMLGIARQTRDHPITVSHLVALRICGLANDRLAELHLQHPEVCRDLHIRALHEMAAAEDLFKPDISGDRAMTFDVLQRVYTDSGHLSLEGFQVLRAFVGGRTGDTAIRFLNIDEIPAQAVLTPAVAAVMASRAEMTDAAEHFWQLVEEDLERPIWQRQPSKADAYIASLRASTLGGTRYMPLMLVAPSMSRLGQHMAIGQSRHEALMVALAIDEYQKRTGRYPEQLQELVPQYLPQVPVDRSSGGLLQYRLKDGNPLLYGLGRDGLDDGGVWTDTQVKWPEIPDSGDWILYPPLKQ